MNENEWELLKNSFNKVRFMYDENDNLIVHENSHEHIQNIQKKFDIVKANFPKFAFSTFSIMRPGNFIRILQKVNGGNELILENIDILLERYSHDRNGAVKALLETKGISNNIVEDFKNKFYLFTYGHNDIQDKYVNNSEYDNFSNIKMDYNRKYRTIQFMKTILEDPCAYNKIKENFDIIFSPQNNSAIPEIVDILKDKSEYRELLKNNIEKVKKAYLEEDLLDFCKLIKNMCPEEYEKHKFIIEKVYEPSIKYLEENKEKFTDDEMLICTDKILKTCGRIISQDRSKDIEQLVEFAGNGEDFELCHDGGTAIVIKTNGKVIKFSANRVYNNDFKIPYHHRILRPIIRKNDVSKNSNQPLFIEVQDEVEVGIEISDEELLGIYKELRDSGIKWCDARKANLGRLKKDNYGYPNGCNIPSNNANLNLLSNETENKILKAGELVIIDDDGIVDAQNDYAFFTPQTPAFIVEYEEEYQKKELKSKAKNKYHEEH